FLKHVLHWRWFWLTAFCGLFIVSLTLVSSGWIRVVLFSSIESDILVADVAFAEGTPSHVTHAAIRRLEQAALALQDELRDASGESPVLHVFSVLGPREKISNQEVTPSQEHRGQVSIERRAGDEQAISSQAMVTRWREKVG